MQWDSIVAGCVDDGFISIVMCSSGFGTVRDHFLRVLDRKVIWRCSLCTESNYFFLLMKGSYLNDSEKRDQKTETANRLWGEANNKKNIKLLANSLIRNAQNTSRTSNEQTSERVRDSERWRWTTRAAITIFGSINRSIANRVTKSSTTSKRNSFLSCFHACSLLFAPLRQPCFVSTSSASRNFFLSAVFFPLHFFLLLLLFFWIVTSSFQFCFSSENFHVSFFLLNFITQILSFHSKFCKRKMRVIQMKWQILWEWKRRNAIEKNVCVFYFVCGIYFYVLSGCLTCILHCLYVFECECFASSFLRLSVSVCLCCGTMKSRALVFKRLLKVKRVCDQRKKSIENHHTTATTAAVKHTHTQQQQMRWHALRVRNNCNGNNIMLG